MPQFKGACHCGLNQYSVDVEPDFQFKCFCHNCRQLNGGGHLAGIMVNGACFQPASHTKTYAYQGGNNDIELHFCPTCATQLYALPKQYPNKIVLRANTLQAGEFVNQQNIFTECAFTWDIVD